MKANKNFVMGTSNTIGSLFGDNTYFSKYYERFKHLPPSECTKMCLQAEAEEREHLANIRAEELLQEKLKEMGVGETPQAVPVEAKVPFAGDELGKLIAFVTSSDNELGFVTLTNENASIIFNFDDKQYKIEKV